MAGVLYLFYRYIAAVVEEETKKKMIFDWPAKIFLIVLEIIALVFPIVYIQTPNGNYSAGAYVIATVRRNFNLELETDSCEEKVCDWSSTFG